MNSKKINEDLKRIFNKENIFRIGLTKYLIMYSGEAFMFLKIGKLKEDDELYELSKSHHIPIECWHYKKMGDRIIKNIERIERI